MEEDEANLEEDQATVRSKRKEEEEPQDESEGEPAPKKSKVEKGDHAVPKKEEDDDDDDDTEEPSKPAKRGRKASSSSTNKPRAPPKTKAKKEEEAEDVEMRDEKDGVLERGHIYFFYRPKVDIGPDDTCSSLDDIAKFYFLMLPRGDSTNKQRFRLFVIGKKRLPDRAKGGREVFWAAQSSFGDDFAHFKTGDALGEKNYTTKTRGTRPLCLT